MYPISGDLKDVFKGDSLQAIPRVIMRLSNNANYTSSVRTDPPEMDKPHQENINDGMYFSSMKFAMTDYGLHLDDGNRVFPRASDEDVFYKAPWVSPMSTGGAGNFDPPIAIVVDYAKLINTNIIQIVSDNELSQRYGDISLMDVFIKTTVGSGETWEKIASDWSPTTRGTAKLYYNSIKGTWNENVGDRSGYMEISAIKVLVKKLSVNPNLPVELKPRRLMLYEIEAGLELDISGDIIDIKIDKIRETTAETLNVLGPSAASTFSITLQNFENTYNNLSKNSPYRGLLTKGVRFKIDYGFKKADGQYEYIPQGIFFADEWKVENSTTNSLVYGRDFSYFLQDNLMEPTIYMNDTLTDVVRDVAERAGVENIDIDISNLSAKDLSTGVETDMLTVGDMKLIDKSNYIWNASGTYWEFLQQVAYSDIGGYWFDEDGRFRYAAKETVYNPDDPNGSDFTPVYGISDSDQIIVAAWGSELMNNSVDVEYLVPEISKSTSSVWEAPSPQVLGSTALAASIDKNATVFKTGNIEDWPDEGFFKIDNEIVEYKARRNNSFEECVRGRLGTEPAPHSPTSLTNWMPNYHTWEPEGGVLKVTGGVAGVWGLLRTKEQFGRNYRLKGKFKITKAPFQAGVAVYVRSFDTYLQFVIRSKAVLGTNDGWDGPNFFELWKVKDGSRTILKTSTDNGPLTGEDHFFEVVVDNNQFKLFVDGNDKLNYTDDNLLAESQAGGIGLMHIGPGPNYFDNITVTKTGESVIGNRIVFNDSFGNVMYEIRHYDAEYTTSPAYAVNYWLTSKEAEVIEFLPGPFSADIYVLNKQDTLTTIEGPNDESEYEGYDEYFILYGKAIINDETHTIEKDFKQSIKKTGKREVSISLPWVQSKTHAKALLDFIIDVYKDEVVFIDAEIFALPHLQLGDIVRVNYDRLGVYDEDFFVIEISHGISSGGYNQNIKLRSKSYGKIPRIEGPNDPPPSGDGIVRNTASRFFTNDAYTNNNFELISDHYTGTNGINISVPWRSVNVGDTYIVRIVAGDREDITWTPHIYVSRPNGWVPIRRDGNSWIFAYYVSTELLKDMKEYISKLLARAKAKDIPATWDSIEYPWTFKFRKEKTGDLTTAPASANFLSFSDVWLNRTITDDKNTASILNGTTNITAPSINTLYDDTVCVWFGTTKYSNINITPPSGMTSKGFARYNASMMVAIQTISSAGATGPKTGTAASNTQTIGQMIALVPASKQSITVSVYYANPPDSFYIGEG